MRYTIAAIVVGVAIFLAPGQALAENSAPRADHGISLQAFMHKQVCMPM
ncbi:hypothetical protein SAMN05216251_106179 [Actinacidiphila alni]|uniref:Uncharacterized protein n=1 Tax=Actinacidiphila alni TaxID=380248 RepID=A0A1I2EF11_9ACTN|nr:hypothetical protein SAMN05216251_106179 [Actinacidiphila alni]